MIIQKLDPALCSQEYGVTCRRLYPLPDVVRPPFGSMWCLVEPGKASSRHNHHEAETYVIAKGSGEMQVDGESMPVGPGDAVYIPPFSMHSLINTSETSDLLFLAVWWEDAALAPDAASGEGEAKVAETSGRTLLTATPPTPNGDLHLGHLSGPYLAADIHARFLKMKGRAVHYISGADDHQSYVVLAGERAGKSPRAVADECADQIETTLRLAGIEMDRFARPRSSPGYAEFVQGFFRRLHESGSVVLKSAPSAYCEACDRYLYEAHISGKCPHCGAGSDGNACEACARPNDCTDLLEARCKHCGGVPTTRLVERFYFPLRPFEEGLRRYYESVSMSPHMTALCEQMLADGLPDIPVSHPSGWGIPVPVPGYEHQRIYAWFEMCPGYLHTARALSDGRTGEGGSGPDCWSPGTDVVQFFGFDNGYFHAVLFPALIMAYAPEAQLPSTFVVNEFYLLDGEKFSTSRRHAIWGGEFLPEVPADFVRFYLSFDRPAHRQTSFTLDGFRHAVQKELIEGWGGWLNRLGRRVGDEGGGRAPSPGAWTAAHRHFFSRLRAFTDQADDAYQASSFSPRVAARTLCELARSGDEFGQAQDYLTSGRRRDERRTGLALELLAAKTLANLAAPLMPGFAGRLREALGFEPSAPFRWEPIPQFIPEGQSTAGLADFQIGSLDQDHR